MRFKSYWRTTVIGAIFLHFFVCLGLALMIPLLDFVGTPLAVQEMEVVDLPEGGDGNAEEQKPEPPKAKPPEPPKPEEQPPPPEELLPMDSSPTEAQELDEAVAAIQEQEKNPNGNNNPSPGPPPPPNMAVGVIVSSGMTPDTRGLDFHGKVGILVNVDERGNITGYRFTQGSGRSVIDQIVLNAVRKFKFDPALDTNGNPMKTKRLLNFPFDGSGPHPFDDDENKRTRANKEIFLREQHQKENAPPA